MYQRILLAYDGSSEGALALHEAALLAQQCCAQIYLLAVVPDTTGTRIAESVYAGVAAEQVEPHQHLLDRAAEWLEARGLKPDARLLAGEPGPTIGAVAEEVDADLVVVSHHHQGFLARWWSGSTDAYLSDHLCCTLLIARNPIGEEGFDPGVRATAQAQGAA